ncbi:MAG: hypothetical protein EBR27_13620, partial [Betaproteobacteria bacterium]|nr:hypothetical protein [Betaproteobacteria bacterium]
MQRNPFGIALEVILKQYIRMLGLMANAMTGGICGASLAFASSGVLAAIDCEQPGDAVARKMCSYTWDATGYTLEDLDVNLNELYRSAMDRVVDKDKLRKEQRAWLKVRDQCADAKCFNDTYDVRIRELTVIPGQSVFNSINFLGSNLGIESDPKMFELVLSTHNRLVTRNGGLKYFDGGVNDFDIVGDGRPIKGTDPENPLCQWVLFGLGKVFTTFCRRPTAPDGTALDIASLPGDRRDGFDEMHEPLSTFLTTNGLELNVVSFDKEKLLTEASGSRCEGLNSFLEARSVKSRKIVWRWAYYGEPTLERTCNFTNKIGAPKVAVKASMYSSPSALLPGGDVLVGLIRIDPRTGLPRDRSRVAVLSKDQAIALKRRL